MLSSVCFDPAKINRGFHTVCAACVEGIVWTIAGLIVACFWKALAPPLYFMGAFTTVTKLVVKLVDSYDAERLDSVKRRVMSLQKKYPGITLASLTLSCLVCVVIPTTGMVLGSCVGILHGITSNYDEVSRAQS